MSSVDRDAAKLRGIDDPRVVELFRSGYLPWIEAHLLSLGNLGRLVARMEGQTAVSDEKGAVMPAVDDTTVTLAAADAVKH